MNWFSSIESTSAKMARLSRVSLRNGIFVRVNPLEWTIQNETQDVPRSTRPIRTLNETLTLGTTGTQHRQKGGRQNKQPSHE